MKKARPLLTLSAISVLLCVPILLHGFPIRGHDARQHLLWSVLFSGQLWDGELYPRWLTGLFHGFGGPSFFVYGPLPYYVSALLTPFSRPLPGHPPGFFELSASAMLAIWGSGLCSYLWLRRISTETAALIAAALYMVSPYHLVVDLYMRAALPEFWAFVWMPLTLYFADRLVNREKYAIPGLAVSFALLIATHLFSALMFGPVAAAYILYFSKPNQRTAILLNFAAGCLLGATLSAAYLFPAIAHEKFIPSAKFRSEPLFHWDLNFLPLDFAFVRMGLWPTFGEFLAMVAVLFAIALPCFAVITRSVFWLAIAVASLLMMFPISSPIWRTAPLIENLQFPWRYMTVLSVAVAALSALSVESFMARRTLLRNLAAAGLCFVAFAWTAFYCRQAYVVSQGDHESGWKIDTTSDQLFRVWSQPGAVGAQTEQIRFDSGAGAATIEKWFPRDIRAKVAAVIESQVTFHQFYYPGWKDRGGLPVDASAQGLIRVKIPAGSNQVRLWLDGGPMETVGAWTSVASAAALALAIILERRRANRSQGDPRRLAPGKFASLGRT